MPIYAFLIAAYFAFGFRFYRYYSIVRFMRYNLRQLCRLRLFEPARTRRFAS
jgi:hypothetical protein